MRPVAARICLVGLLGIGLVAEARGQALSLGDALARADSSAYANRAAHGMATARAAEQATTLQGVLPTLRLEGGYLRTTDPLAAFGFVLRQRAVTPAAFGPATLNYPDSRGNYAAAVIIEQPIINPDIWYARSAAMHAAAASRADEGWTRRDIRLRVVEAYHGAILAVRQIGTLEAAAKAAHEHVRQAERMAENGLVTRSDVLLADVRAGQLDARLLAARGQAEVSRRQLALLMGTPRDSSFALPADLPSGGTTRAWADAALGTGTSSTGLRFDVQAAEASAGAAAQDLGRAKARLLPRLNAFGRYDWNSPTAPYQGDRSWTVGVMVSWSPFSGGAEWGDVRAARGRRETARAMAEAVEGRAEVELASRRSDLTVARASLDISERAVTQAAEAHRIVGRKYEGGLASVVELLDAAATDTEARLRFSQATWQLIVSTAAYRQARGEDPAALAGPEE